MTRDLADTVKARWRVGRTIPLNVYENDRPVCQCHNELDAKAIVDAMNATGEGIPIIHGAAELAEHDAKIRREAYDEGINHGIGEASKTWDAEAARIRREAVAELKQAIRVCAQERGADNVYAFIDEYLPKWANEADGGKGVSDWADKWAVEFMLRHSIKWAGDIPGAVQDMALLLRRANLLGYQEAENDYRESMRAAPKPEGKE
jgi:hypothetical protein